MGLFDKKPDHPMADIKSAQELLDDLPKNDALKALQELSSWIESVSGQAGFRLDHQVAVLRLLDETARPFERKLMREYFAAGSTLSEFQENRLWMVLSEFFTQIAQAYLHTLARYRNGDKGSSAIKPVLPLIAVRGICAVAGRIKCAAVRHASVDPSAWANLAGFYTHAEAQQCLDEAIQPYSGQGANTTSVRCEFAGVLLWYTASTGKLNRIQTHLAERLVAHMNKNLTVSAQGGQGSLLGFDVQHPAPPMRMSAATIPGPGLRFLGASNLRPHFEALLKMLAKNTVPEEINLGGTYDASAVRYVAQHLASCLSAPPKRRSVRHNICADLSVAIGLSGVMEQTGIGLNFGDCASITWQVEDISVGGFSCVLPELYAKEVAIGSLLGIRPEKADQWGVGIVRRLNRDRQNNLHAGVEMLASQITGVVLCGDSTCEGQPALWLHHPGGDSGEARLLMNPGAFSGGSLQLKLGGKSYLLMPLELEVKGEDYDLARFRKIEEDTSSLIPI